MIASTGPHRLTNIINGPTRPRAPTGRVPAFFFACVMHSHARVAPHNPERRERTRLALRARGRGHHHHRVHRGPRASTATQCCCSVVGAVVVPRRPRWGCVRLWTAPVCRPALRPVGCRLRSCPPLCVVPRASTLDGLEETWEDRRSADAAPVTGLGPVTHAKTDALRHASVTPPIPPPGTSRLRFRLWSLEVPQRPVAIDPNVALSAIRPTSLP